MGGVDVDRVASDSPTLRGAVEVMGDQHGTPWFAGRLTADQRQRDDGEEHGANGQI
jgi:hypothetical protein